MVVTAVNGFNTRLVVDNGGMPIEMSPDEQRVLLQTLQEELGRLKPEINRTEAHDFKEELKGREATLQSIIGRLESTGG